MATAETFPLSNTAIIWIGRFLSGVVVVLLLLDAIMKVVKTEVSMEATIEMGYPANMVAPIGWALLVSTVLYAIPRTYVLGAILITGYLGGAVASHVRLEQREFFFAVVAGVLVWLGLFLRDRRVRALVPLVSKRDHQ